MSCVSATFCWAVGSYNADDGTGSKTLAERWDGVAWRGATTPDAALGGGGGDELDSVSCVALTDCWAVGGGEGYGSNSLAEHWDGSSWTVVATQNEVGGHLNAVDCVDADDCWAGGFYGTPGNPSGPGGLLLEHWTGEAWTIDPAFPATTTSNIDAIEGLTCTAADDCWGVGSPSNSNPGGPLIVHWDGAAWRSISPLSRSPVVSLSSVACTTASHCFAVGSSTPFFPGSSSSSALVEEWDGASWRSNSQALNGALSGVACPSAGMCIATGNAPLTTGAMSQPISYVWDGATWQPATVPAPSASTPPYQSGLPVFDLAAVSCPSSADCWAVGSAPTASAYGQRVLAEQWSADPG